MNKHWSAILVTLSLSAAYACSDSDVNLSPSMNGGTSGGGDGHAGSAARAGRGGESSAGLGGTSEGGAGERGGDAGTGGRVAVDAGAGGQAGEGGAGEGGAGGTANGESGSAGEGGSAGAPSDDPLGPHCQGCKVTILKSPLWKLSGALMSVAPVGAPEDGGAPFYEWLGTLLSPGHELYPEGVFGPGSLHTGPYDNEPFAAFTAGNVTPKQLFSVSEFAAPNGVALVLSVVPLPSAPTGSSPDFAAGPIIPNALFPFFIDGDLYRNAAIYDDAFDAFYPGFPSFDPPIVKDGASHLVVPFAENSGFVPNVKPKGSYVFRISVVDASEAGWLIDVPFVVQ